MAFQITPFARHWQTPTTSSTSPTRHAHRLQEARSDYGTNTARQRPRFAPPVAPELSTGDITAERAAFCDLLYDAAGFEHSYPRDIGIAYDHAEGDEMTLCFAGREWPVTVVLTFDFMDRLRYRVQFAEEDGGGQYALTQAQVRHLRVPQATLSDKVAEEIEIVLRKRGSGRRHPARIPAKQLTS